MHALSTTSKFNLFYWHLNNNQAEQELKEQSNKAAKIMEKQEKPIDKYKNEKLKALLSLYAKPMVGFKNEFHFQVFTGISTI